MKKCVCLLLIKAVKKQEILFERCSTIMKNSVENSVENSDQNILKLKYLLEKDVVSKNYRTQEERFNRC